MLLEEKKSATLIPKLPHVTEATLERKLVKQQGKLDIIEGWDCECSKENTPIQFNKSKAFKAVNNL